MTVQNRLDLRITMSTEVVIETTSSGEQKSSSNEVFLI
jgi:hypothetical protein